MLASSAFVMLNVSVRSNTQQILEAYDERRFEGVPEAELEGARSRLTLARDRLGEELRFLSDIAPARAREALANLCDGREVAIKMAGSLPNLSRVNAYAALLARHGGVVLGGADQALREFDPAAAREAIDQSRAASGFPQITDGAWSKEISKFHEDHARYYFDGLSSLDDPPATLARILEQHVAGTSDWYASLLSKVVDTYDRWSEPQLVEIEESLDHLITSVRQSPSDIRLVRSVEQQLARWDAVNQPVQLRDQSNGLDEPKSKRIFDKVRNLAIWLANDCGEYPSAYGLSQALERTFPELPSVVAQLSVDLEALAPLVEQSRSQKMVEPLASVAERAKGDLGRVASGVLKGNFSAGGRGLTGDLYRQHATAAALSTQLSPADLPWQLTRSVALELNNEASEPHAAAIILETILKGAPAETAITIKGDLAALHGLKLKKEFNEALKLNDLKTAQRLATRIVAEVEDEREEYINVAATLEKRLVQRRRIFWFWVILAGIIGLLAFANSGEKTPTGSSTPYDPTPYNSSGGANESPTPEPMQQTIGEEDTSAETAPPIGIFGPLTITQLRYCKFQERRLQLLKDQVPPSAASQFNSVIDDWNSRCHDTQFRHTDGVQIDGEVAQNGAKIQSEVTQTLTEWAPAPAPIPAPISSPSDSGQSAEEVAVPSWQTPLVDPTDPSTDNANNGE